MVAEATLVKLEADFRRVGGVHGGDLKVASQYRFKNQIKWDVGKGTCHGLSIMWLAFRHAPTMGNGMLEELLGGTLSPASQTLLQDLTGEMHSAQSSKFEDESVGAARTRKAMARFSMNFRETKLFGGGWGKGHTDLGKYIANNPGYYMVDIPGHAMAACSAKGTLSFYDPNMGQVSFLNGSKMGSFFSEYFKTSEMNRCFSAPGKKMQVTTGQYM